MTSNMQATAAWYGDDSHSLPYHHDPSYSSHHSSRLPASAMTGTSSSSSSSLNGHGHSHSHQHQQHSHGELTLLTPPSQRIKRQVGRPRIETNKVPAEITDKLERTRALGRERQRRKRERDRQSAMASPAVGGGGGYENSNGTLSMKQEHGGHYNRREDGGPPDSPNHRIRPLTGSGYHESPTSSSLSFEPLNLTSSNTTTTTHTSSSYLETTSPAHPKGPSPSFEQPYRPQSQSQLYQASPSRTTMSTPSMDIPSRIPPDIMSPPSHLGSFFASNVIQALHASPDLRDNTLRGLAMSEADLEAMRDELAAAYDRYRMTIRPTTTTTTTTTSTTTARNGYDDGGMGYNHGMGSTSNGDVFPRSAPASLMRSDSWAAATGIPTSSPRHERFGGARGGGSRHDNVVIVGGSGNGSGSGSGSGFDRSVSSLDQKAISTPHESRVTGLNIHFGTPRGQSPPSSMAPPPPGGHLDHHYNTWGRESYKVSASDGDYDGSGAVIATIEASPMIQPIQTPGSTLRPIRPLPGDTSPYQERGGMSSSSGYVQDTAPLPMAYNTMHHGGNHGMHGEEVYHHHSGGYSQTAYMPSHGQ